MKAVSKESPDQPDPVGRTLGSPSRVILTAIGVFIISQAIGAFTVELIYGLIHPGSRGILTDSITAQFFYILIAEGLAAWFAIYLVRSKRLNLSVIGLGRRPQTSDIAKAVGGFLVYYAILLAVGVLVNYLSPDLENQQQNLGFTNIQTGTENLLAFISLVILPPLGEETLIRGYLYSGLRKVWRFLPALAVTSLMFGLAHLEFGNGGPLVWAAAIDTAILSIVLCYLREKSGALYAGILVHMMNNLIAFGVHFK
jgi:membrane protease YdiL (CAAX protease family)